MISFPWINFLIMIFSSFFMWLTYVISLNPKEKEMKIGEKAWRRSAIFRNLSNLSEGFMILSMILSLWYPIQEYNWEIFESSFLGLLISLILAIPLVYIDYRGIVDVGKETFIPKKEAKIVTNGIYKYIRHPQTIGEMSLFVLGALILNSWLILIWWILFFSFYFPTIKIFEERDLVRRFGQDYIEYRRITGAYFPKIRFLKN